jgi:hypothetical protein
MMPAQDIVVFHCNDSWIDREIGLSNSSQIICSASKLTTGSGNVLSSVYKY